MTVNEVGQVIAYVVERHLLGSAFAPKQLDAVLRQRAAFARPRAQRTRRGRTRPALRHSGPRRSPRRIPRTARRSRPPPCAPRFLARTRIRGASPGSAGGL